MAKTAKEIADELGAMMNGDALQKLSDDAAPSDGPAAMLPPPSSTVKAAVPTIAKAKATPTTVMPVASKPATTSPIMRRPAPVPNPHPASPTPPAAKAAAPVAPGAPTRPSRPAAPKPAAAASAPAAVKPPRPLSSQQLAPVEYAKPAIKKAAKLPFYAAVDFRQTLIPPLLVGGAGLVVLAILFFVQPSDAALRHLGATVPIVVGLIGIVLLAIAGLNMTKVGKQLAAQATAKASKVARPR